MKKLRNILVDFVREDFNGIYYLCNVLFLAVCLYINYAFEFENKYIEPHKRHLYSYIITYIYYFGPYLFSITFYVLTHDVKDRSLKLSKTTLRHIFVLFLILSIYIAFYHHKLWIEAYLPVEVQFLTKLIANNFISAVLMFVMAYVYWRYMDGSVSNHFYGFTSKGVNLKPYFAMILIMLPLIYYASHQPDFLRSYPVYYAHDALTYFKVPEWILVLVFEVNYGFDFVATELFFRGLLVIGLSRYMGSACVLPMVTTYCFIHFGKPFGEALSSILGGYVLGIFAYKTRSIYGGVIIHLAVAYMMEVGGYLGNRYFIELP